MTKDLGNINLKIFKNEYKLSTYRKIWYY
jgi:hypothetical protein